MEHKKEFTHESYGQICLSRIYSSHKNVLYGSDTKHSSFISLRIKKSKLVHEFSDDFFHQQEDIIEVYLSPIQFSQLVLSVGNGDGIPCTINYLFGKCIDSPPEIGSEATRIKNIFLEKIENLSSTVSEPIQKIKDILEIRKLPKKESKEIQNCLNSILVEIKNNIPYMMESLVDSVQKISDASKVNIED